jgi:DNA replication protein DnaC
MLKIQLYKNVKAYIDNLDLNFAQGKGILISGDIGTGKSTAVMNIAKAACDRKKNIRIIYMSELINNMFSEDSVLDNISSYDALFIENIESVYVKRDSNYVETVIDSLFSLSIKYNVPLFITTHLDKNQLKQKLTPHAFSLLHEICDIYSLEGVDIRKNSTL